jgi:hypothetical protein
MFAGYMFSPPEFFSGLSLNHLDFSPYGHLRIDPCIDSIKMSDFSPDDGIHMQDFPEFRGRGLGNFFRSVESGLLQSLIYFE